MFSSDFSSWRLLRFYMGTGRLGVHGAEAPTLSGSIHQPLQFPSTKPPKTSVVVMFLLTNPPVASGHHVIFMIMVVIMVNIWSTLVNTASVNIQKPSPTTKTHHTPPIPCGRHVPHRARGSTCTPRGMGWASWQRSPPMDVG